MDTPRTDATMWSALPDAVPPPSFKTVKRGFDQNQVVDYISRLNERVRSHERQVRQLRQESEQIKRERDAALRERAELLQRSSATTEGEAADGAKYEQLSDRVTKVLSGLDREVERIRAEAEAEAKQILEHARSEAYRVSREAEDARVAATMAAQRATKRAERSVSEMEARRAEVLRQLRTTCSGFLEVVQNLTASIDGKGSVEPVEQGNGSAPKAEEPVVIPDVTPDTA
jgi:cell division septum initiation protein DivIVA